MLSTYSSGLKDHMSIIGAYGPFPQGGTRDKPSAHLKTLQGPLYGLQLLINAELTLHD